MFMKHDKHYWNTCEVKLFTFYLVYNALYAYIECVCEGGGGLTLVAKWYMPYHVNGATCVCMH